jgi:hypothetical protein
MDNVHGGKILMGINERNYSWTHHCYSIRGFHVSIEEQFEPW